MTERVLVVAAHPDDETVGCGACIAKHIAGGDTVHVLILADGVGSREAKPQDVDERKACAVMANGILGTHSLLMLAFEDNQLDKYPLLEIVKPIEEKIKAYSPSIVYTHYKGDLNVDHRVTSQAVDVACRPQPGCSVKRLLYFEVACSTAWGYGFLPDYFVDVSEFLHKKQAALTKYAIELRAYPHPRSYGGVDSLAMMRGSGVGLSMAEAFMTGRVIA